MSFYLNKLVNNYFILLKLGKIKLFYIYLNILFQICKFILYLKLFLYNIYYFL